MGAGEGGGVGGVPKDRNRSSRRIHVLFVSPWCPPRHLAEPADSSTSGGTVAMTTIQGELCGPMCIHPYTPALLFSKLPFPQNWGIILSCLSINNGCLAGAEHSK